jgi:hypothetical protein
MLLIWISLFLVIMFDILVDKYYNFDKIKINKIYINLGFVFINTIIFFIVSYLYFNNNIINVLFNSLILLITFNFILYFFSYIKIRIDNILFNTLINKILIGLAISFVITMLLLKFINL